MLTPKEQKIIGTIRREAAVTGEGDARKKSVLRREQRTLLAIIDRLTGAQALEACRLLVKWHSGVFDGGKQVLRFDNGYPIDRTDVDEANRLARIALGITIPITSVVPSTEEILAGLLCDDCPPPNEHTSGFRCAECPRLPSVNHGP